MSRSLAACEGALLVVDAAQGVEAQSVANCYTALEQGLEVLPVINKIDLPSADPTKVIHEIEEIIGIPADDAALVSAKTGLGVPELLEHLVKRIPPPKGDPDGPLQALIIDSWFDNYVGVVSLVRVMNGALQSGAKIRVMSTGRSHVVDKLGRFTPKPVTLRSAADRRGRASWSPASRRSTALRSATRSRSRRIPAREPLAGFKQVQPRVFAGLFPVSSDDYEQFRDALKKLKLNDSALHFEPEVSTALGFGFRCGFLGLLHMEIVQERLEREYDLELITSAPTVIYEVLLHRRLGGLRRQPVQAAAPGSDRGAARAHHHRQHPGAARSRRRGAHACAARSAARRRKMLFLGSQVSLQYELPLAEVVLDFFDRLKSASRGYASFDYEFHAISRRRRSVKLDMLINGDPVDALSLIVHRDSAYQRGRELVDKMQELIPRQMFEVAVQAAIGSHIIARATVKAMRKNVLAKCYGGDITRKRKLLEKQKAGKKRMKQVGQVEIPQEAFLAVLQVGKKTELIRLLNLWIWHMLGVLRE